MQLCLTAPCRWSCRFLPTPGRPWTGFDAVRGDFVRGADAREQQKLGRIDRAAAQDHLPLRADLMSLPLAGIFDAHGAAVLDENARGLRPGDDGEIGTLQGWRQVAGGGARAPAIGHGAIDGAEALLARAVEIGGIRIARLLAGLDPGQTQRPADAGPRNLERAGAAVMPVSPWQIGLRLLEIGQDIVPGPAAIAKLRPYVVVAWHAPYIDHGVYGTRPAEHPAARPEQPRRPFIPACGSVW